MPRDIRQRFASHVVEPEEARKMAVVRERCLSLADVIERCVPEPERHQAIDLIEQAMMIANAGISRGPVP